jgi:hypothetical protein
MAIKIYKQKYGATFSVLPNGNKNSALFHGKHQSNNGELQTSYLYMVVQACNGFEVTFTCLQGAGNILSKMQHK